jgi:uncharacterized protein YbgA (DUF1722 family)/uncharacterized protein YbbK (DUF523 family)
MSGAKPETIRPRLAVSACLLGHEVRHDGAHARRELIADRLARFVEFIPICPEVEAGMGTPRPAVRLVDRDGAEGMLDPKSGTDWTAALLEAARVRIQHLRHAGIHGGLFKKNSPSCGVTRVKIHDARTGMPQRSSPGLFVNELTRSWPELPIEEDGRLNDPHLAQTFLTRVFANARLDAALGPCWKPVDLVRFHSREKYLLLAHSPALYRELGALVARAGSSPRDALANAYRTLFARALAQRVSRGRLANVLQHSAGYLRGRVDSARCRDLDMIIRAFGAGRAPLLEPLSILRHHLRQDGTEWIASQSYLDPYPEELQRAVGALYAW